MRVVTAALRTIETDQTTGRLGKYSDHHAIVHGTDGEVDGSGLLYVLKSFMNFLKKFVRSSRAQILDG